MTEQPGEYVTPWFNGEIPKMEKAFECFRCGALLTEAEGRFRQHTSVRDGIVYTVIEHYPTCLPLSDYAKEKVKAMTTTQALEWYKDGNPVSLQPKATKRIRANISISVKGQKTFDATVELVGEYSTSPAMRQDLIKELDALVADLEARCPRIESGA